jgi:hypothetical protein
LEAIVPRGEAATVSAKVNGAEAVMVNRDIAMANTLNCIDLRAILESPFSVFINLRVFSTG